MSKGKKRSNKSIAIRLKSLMDGKDLTQKDVANLTGASQPSVVNWLQGATPNGSNFAQLLSRTGLHADWFFEITPDLERAKMVQLNIESEPKKIAKKPVDNVSVSGNIERVNPLLPELIERLKKATSERGKKTALAGFLDVPLTMVSQWLSGDREPGGETTLKLLHWVEAQERQK